MNIIMAQRAGLDGKFQVKIDGKLRWVYFIDYGMRDVIKIDGEHTYLWYRDSRIDKEMDIKELNPS